jgi:gas vesicle protein
MNKTVTILLGVAAGTVLALAAFTKRGKRVRAKISKRVGDMASTIEEKAKSVHDSAVSYS